MKAEVKKIDSSLAKALLLANNNNRKQNKEVVNNYVKMMLEGRWKENGESIIIDKKGIVKDGQHRLKAIVESNKEYNFVLVSGVNPDVMDTIDTGKNRSLADILKLEGFTNSVQKASIIRSIIYFNRTERLSVRSRSNSSKKFVSNNEGLNYAYENNENLDKLVKQSINLYNKSKKLVPISSIGKILYSISLYKIEDVHIDFMKHIVGSKYEEKTAPSYVFDMVYKSYKNKTPLTRDWISKASIKAWNMFVNGNPTVKYIKVGKSIEQPVLL